MYVKWFSYLFSIQSALSLCNFVQQKKRLGIHVQLHLLEPVTELVPLLQRILQSKRMIICNKYIVE
jgi:hypothetical protein